MFDELIDGGSDAGWITTMEDKEYDSIEAAEELNMMDVKYALFSYKAETGKYHVWNAGEVRAWDGDEDASANYNPGEVSPAVPSWDDEVEFPENDYGEVIAVCCGKGLWVSTKWDFETPCVWCSNDSPMYSFQWDCRDLSGAEVAKKMYAADKDLTGSIFATIKDFESIEGDGTQGHYFLPSNTEIVQILPACAVEIREATMPPYVSFITSYYNAIHFIQYNNILSCNQDNYQSTDVYYMGAPAFINSKLIDSTPKSAGFNAVIGLHFGPSLVSETPAE